MARVLSFDIRVRYPGFTLDVAADIPLTGITALSGPSGSGKTTLLRVIAGLESPDEGSVRFADQDWTALRAAARGVGYVFQDARLFPHLSVAQNLNYGARRRGIAAERVQAVIAALDLDALLGRAPATLSGGEMRRVALGRALASGPRILLLDEPLTGLDRARKADLMPYIARAVAGFGVPALYVTHAQGEIDFLADRTLSIADGRLQGWSPAAPRLVGQVSDRREGQVQLALGDTQVWLPGTGDLGETWAVPLGEAYVLTTRDPGTTSAALTLAGRVVAPQGTSCRVSVADQVLDLTWPGAGSAGLVADQPVWLSLPKVAGRRLDSRSDAFDSH